MTISTEEPSVVSSIDGAERTRDERVRASVDPCRPTNLPDLVHLLDGWPRQPRHRSQQQIRRPHCYTHQRPILFDTRDSLYPSCQMFLS